MTKEKAATLIESDFSLTHFPNITRVEYKNGEVFHGFFHNYPDSPLLRKEFKYRFVLQNNSVEFREGYDKTGSYDTKHSIIIDAAEVKKIGFVNAFLEKVDLA
jgi:hypothetical protein